MILRGGKKGYVHERAFARARREARRVAEVWRGFTVWRLKMQEKKGGKRLENAEVNTKR